MRKTRTGRSRDLQREPGVTEGTNPPQRPGDVVTAAACSVCNAMDLVAEADPSLGVWPEHCGRPMRLAEYAITGASRAQLELTARELLAKPPRRLSRQAAGK